jgi:hypothetical protein
MNFNSLCGLLKVLGKSFYSPHRENVAEERRGRIPDIFLHPGPHPDPAPSEMEGMEKTPIANPKRGCGKTTTAINLSAPACCL